MSSAATQSGLNAFALRIWPDGSIIPTCKGHYRILSSARSADGAIWDETSDGKSKGSQEPHPLGCEGHGRDNEKSRYRNAALRLGLRRRPKRKPKFALWMTSAPQTHLRIHDRSCAGKRSSQRIKSPVPVNIGENTIRYGPSRPVDFRMKLMQRKSAAGSKGFSRCRRVDSCTHMCTRIHAVLKLLNRFF